MSFIDTILGNTAAQPIEAIGNAFDKLFTSDEERMQAQAVLEKLRQHPGELQVELNKIEAGHRSIFVAGWRPALGWICAIGLAFPFVINPIIQWATSSAGPQLPLDHLTELVYAMLGLAGMRTVEKAKGKSK